MHIVTPHYYRNRSGTAFTEIKLQHHDARTYNPVHKTCNISTSEGRGRTTIYIDSTILLLEVAGRFSSRSSDRKSRKRQNSTSKQTLNCHGVFSEINSHQSWFLTQTANTLIYFSEEVQKVRGALPEGFQTFEHHLKVSPSQIRGEFN